MAKGQVVKVRLFGGKIAYRRVVADKDEIVVICPEDEYQNAKTEGREPLGLGFPREDIIEHSFEMSHA